MRTPSISKSAASSALFFCAIAALAACSAGTEGLEGLNGAGGDAGTRRDTGSDSSPDATPNRRDGGPSRDATSGDASCGDPTELETINSTRVWPTNGTMYPRVPQLYRPGDAGMIYVGYLDDGVPHAAAYNERTYEGTSVQERVGPADDWAEPYRRVTYLDAARTMIRYEGQFGAVIDEGARPGLSFGSVINHPLGFLAVQFGGAALLRFDFYDNNFASGGYVKSNDGSSLDPGGDARQVKLYHDWSFGRDWVAWIQGVRLRWSGIDGRAGNESEACGGARIESFDLAAMDDRFMAIVECEDRIVFLDTQSGVTLQTLSCNPDRAPPAIAALDGRVIAGYFRDDDDRPVLRFPRERNAAKEIRFGFMEAQDTTAVGLDLAFRNGFWVASFMARRGEDEALGFLLFEN